jgi:class II lanthipeptide synthase
MTAPWLETAQLIGARIVEQAIWHEDRCNWVGASTGKGLSGEPVLTYATLGADLYDGTAGIAIFLAELAAATGRAGYRRTALGAIRQALAREPDLPPALNLGLYTGRIGIALATARVGSLLADDDLLEHSLAIVRHPQGAGNEFDLISGRAGAIVGLLALEDLLDEPRLKERASLFGEELIGLAVKKARSWSWPTPGNPRARHLLGFSHGASGAGYALCELAHATKNETFQDAAEKAFSYERRLFDAREANWPDLRAAASSTSRSAPAGFMTAWCHGAPGIALSRLRAFELTAAAAYRDEAIAAVATTHRHVQAVARSDAGNYSLCHGLCGNSEVLLHAKSVLGDGGESEEKLAMRVAETGRDSFAKPGASWPCGSTGGQTPSLMLGLAGIGLFYLRLHDPRIPSVLQIHEKQNRADQRAAHDHNVIGRPSAPKSASRRWD